MSKVRENTLRVDMTRNEALWTPEDVVLFYGDSAANVIVFELINADGEVDSTGYAAILSIKRPDGALVAVECDNDTELSCTLPGSVYERYGTLGCVLRLTDDSGTSTAVSFSVPVRASADGGATGVVESEVIPVSEMQILVERMRAMAATGVNIVGVVANADALDGVTGQIGQGYIVGQYLYLWTDVGWAQGAKLEGDNGVGIDSIERTAGTGAAGTTDTYTITYTDETISTFTVYNGADGEDGAAGADGVSVTESTEFESLTTTAKTLPGAINELVGDMQAVADALDAIMGEASE